MTIALGIFLIIFLAGNVSAVVVSSMWETGSTRQEEIDFGESIDFNVTAGTMNPPMEISLTMYDSDNNKIMVFEDNKKLGSPDDTYSSFYSTYIINKEIYEQSGDYYPAPRHIRQCHY